MPLTDQKKKAWHSVHKAYSLEVAAALPKKKVRVVFPPKEEIAEPVKETETKKSYWLRKINEDTKVEEGEVKHSNPSLQYKSFEWNETENTVVNKGIKTTRDNIELKGKYEGKDYIVELQFAKPYKSGGDFETSILIYSPDLPDINKISNKNLKKIIKNIIKEEV